MTPGGAPRSEKPFQDRSGGAGRRRRAFRARAAADRPAGQDLRRGTPQRTRVPAAPRPALPRPRRRRCRHTSRRGRRGCAARCAARRVEGRRRRPRRRARATHRPPPPRLRPCSPARAARCWTAPPAGPPAGVRPLPAARRRAGPSIRSPGHEAQVPARALDQVGTRGRAARGPPGPEAPEARRSSYGSAGWCSSSSSTACRSRADASGLSTRRTVLIKRHRDREQPLDDDVVQVLGDPVAVFQQAEALGVLPGLGQLQRDGRLPGEGVQHAHVRRAERDAAGALTQRQHARAPTPAAPERHRCGRAHARHRTEVTAGHLAIGRGR